MVRTIAPLDAERNTVMLSGLHRNSLQEQVVYGGRALDRVRALAAALAARRCMSVPPASHSGPEGLATRLAGELGASCVGVFAGVSAHSPREAVIAAADQARSLRADLLVAFGGGSAIDAAKVVQLCLWAGATRTQDLDGLRAGADLSALKPTVRMIAVPTTLSAAEFTPFAGVTDTARKAKEGYAHPLLAPRAVILDPAVTLATPPRLWFSTGMKAVDHAVEQLCNPVRSPYADAPAAEGLRGLSQALPATKTAPADLDARLECQIGMWLAMAGASSGRGLGASHAIGHTLGGGYGVPHGLTSCVALPAVLKWNRAVAPERQAGVAGLVGRAEPSAAEAVKALGRSLDPPTDIA